MARGTSARGADRFARRRAATLLADPCAPINLERFRSVRRHVHLDHGSEPLTNRCRTEIFANSQTLGREHLAASERTDSRAADTRRTLTLRLERLVFRRRNTGNAKDAREDDRLRRERDKSHGVRGSRDRIPDPRAPLEEVVPLEDVTIENSSRLCRTVVVKRLPGSRRERRSGRGRGGEMV